MKHHYKEEEIGDHLNYWLYNTGRVSSTLSVLCSSLLDELIELELSVERLNLGVFVMHPELAGVAYQITPASRFPTAITISHASLESEVYLRSPIRKAVEERIVQRWKLTPVKALPYPFLEELRSDGFTDYIVLPLLGTHERVHVVSIATKQAGGFRNDVFHALSEFAHPLAMLVDSLTSQRLSEVLLQLYVGRKTGTRVLNGEVNLGEGHTIRAALFYSDMRDFSSLCNKVGVLKTIDTLNKYLSIVSTVIQEEGGEILKFMGDAIMAIFPIDVHVGTNDVHQHALDTSAANACLRAAGRSLSQIQKWNLENNETPIRSGFGLTLGDVFYGNIGAPGRLDFTVIGETVNLAARLEALCKVYESDILIGPNFQNACDTSLKSYGKCEIKGFPEAVAIHGTFSK